MLSDVLFSLWWFCADFGGMKGYKFLKQKFERIQSLRKNRKFKEILPVFQSRWNLALLLEERTGSFWNFQSFSFCAYELGKKLCVSRSDCSAGGFLNEMQSCENRCFSSVGSVSNSGKDFE